MGDPMTYLSVEVSDCTRQDDVRDALAEWNASWASVTTFDNVVASQYHGIDVKKAKNVIEKLGEAVKRALILTMNDSTRVGRGLLFARVDDSLLLLDDVRGGENRGTDIVDYVRRHYGFVGVGYDV